MLPHLVLEFLVAALDAEVALRGLIVTWYLRRELGDSLLTSKMLSLLIYLFIITWLKPSDNSINLGSRWLLFFMEEVQTKVRAFRVQIRQRTRQKLFDRVRFQYWLQEHPPCQQQA